MDEASLNAAIADLTSRIAAAKANGDSDPLNRLADMEQYLRSLEDQLRATTDATERKMKNASV